MASAGKTTVSGISVACIGAGVLLVYAGWKGKSLLGEVQSVISGKPPSAAKKTNPITDQTQTGGGAPSGGYDITTNIPAGKGSYSRSQLEQLWTSNGGPSDTAAFAAAIAEAESGGSATVTSSNPDGGTNVGIFQLDTNGVGAGYSVAELQDANLNTQITIMATSGGTNWQEWGDPVAAAVGYHYTPGAPVP